MFPGGDCVWVTPVSAHHYTAWHGMKQALLLFIDRTLKTEGTKQGTFLIHMTQHWERDSVQTGLCHTGCRPRPGRRPLPSVLKALYLWNWNKSLDGMNLLWELSMWKKLYDAVFIIIHHSIIISLFHLDYCKWKQPYFSKMFERNSKT